MASRKVVNAAVGEVEGGAKLQMPKGRRPDSGLGFAKAVPGSGDMPMVTLDYLASFTPGALLINVDVRAAERFRREISGGKARDTYLRDSQRRSSSDGSDTASTF